MNPHDHEHPHPHSDAAVSTEETLALLRYMAEHNAHHAQELHELAHTLSGDAAALLHAAIYDYDTGTEKLKHVIELLKES